MTEAQSSTAADDATLWIAMAIAWAAFSLFAWASAWLLGATSITSSWATTMGLLIVAVSVQLRWRTLSLATTTAETACHLVWILGWLASINWLGYIALRCSSFPAAVPALTLIAAGEWWMLRRVPAGRLAWLEGLQQSLTNRFSSRHSPRGESGEWTSPPPATPTAESAASHLQNSCAAPLEESVQRNSIDGLDENGKRFLSGDVRIRLLPLQQSETVVIGFCPAFASVPEVEVECEADDITARITHCTAVGMRISLRRPRSSDEIEFLLSWYAVQADPVAGAAGWVSDRLP